MSNVAEPLSKRGTIIIDKKFDGLPSRSNYEFIQNINYLESFLIYKNKLFFTKSTRRNLL